MKLRSAAVRHLAASSDLRRRTVPRDVTYVICTNPRSGSWLLSDGLAMTRVAGNPREWFNPAQEQQYTERWSRADGGEPTYADYLRIVRLHSATRNGVRGVKVHHYQLAALPAKVQAIPALSGRTGAEILAMLFPDAKHIWLRRRDKLRQAISLFVAQATDEWYLVDGTAGVSGDGPHVEFDGEAIASRRDMLTAADEAWASYFAEHGIAPLVIWYEDFVASYEETIRGVVGWLGVENAAAVEIRPPRLHRQTDARTERWLAGHEAAVLIPSTSSAGR